MVAEVGLEPTRSCLRQILSLLWLPISPLGHPLDCTAVLCADARSERLFYRAAGERRLEDSRKWVQGETERVSPCRAMSAQKKRPQVRSLTNIGPV